MDFSSRVLEVDAIKPEDLNASSKLAACHNRIINLLRLLEFIGSDNNVVCYCVGLCLTDMYSLKHKDAFIMPVNARRFQVQ